jgi:pyruvate-formate lyase-activating enzyme
MWVNLEPTNACQLDCLFCSRQLSKRPIGYLDLELAETIFAEMAERPGAAVRLAGWGEPLLHPRIGRLAEMIKAKGLKMKIYTNGLALTPELMDLFIDLEVDDLQFSLQGLTPEQYEKNRIRASYLALKENILMAAQRRGRRSRPFLSLLTSVLADELAEADPARFTQEWLGTVDKVAVDLTNLNFVGESPRVKPHLGRQSAGLKRGLCVDVFLALEVKFDGAIQFCGQDSQGLSEHTVGYAPATTLAQAWRSPAMEAKREVVGRRLKHADFAVCRNCYHNTDKYDLFKLAAEKETA